MLNPLKQVGKNISRELNRTWENLAEGWHELLSRSNAAITYFARKKDLEHQDNRHLPSDFPSWSLLSGEVEETEKEILVKVEVPGIEKENCHITIDNNLLYISGEKHIKRESHDSTYHIMERAYGTFQRTILLPHNVNTDEAVANYQNGVLIIRLPKTDDEKTRTIILT